MKRTYYCFITAVVLLLSVALTGCSGQGGDDVTGTAVPDSGIQDTASETQNATETAGASETVEETKAPEPLTFDLKSTGTVTVVTSSTAGTSTQLSTVLNAFLTRLKKVPGITVKTVSDNTPSAGGPEIVIGHGKREGSTELYTPLGPSDWTLTVSGSSIFAVGGTPDATAKALYYLLTNYINKDLTEYTEGVLSSYSSGESMPELPAKVTQSFDELKGLTVYAIGDSYFAGEGLDPNKQVWPALMALKYGQTFVNHGKGGSTVSNYITTNNPMCERISSMKQGTPDIVLFEGGANDWNHMVPLGNAGSTDTRTFRGAVASCIEQLHAKYPSALIVCISNWDYGQKNGSGVDSTAYAKAFCEIAEGYAYTCVIRAYDTSVIPAYMSNAVFRAKYSITPSDRSHLNAEGHALVFQSFERLISEGFRASKNK